MVLIGLFGVVPIIWSFVLSFQQNDLVAAGTWIGLDNYRRLAHDPMFADSIRRTIVYTLLFVPLTLIGALAVSVALNRRLVGMRFYRTAVFTPVVTSTVATASSSSGCSSRRTAPSTPPSPRSAWPRSSSSRAPTRRCTASSR